MSTSALITMITVWTVVITMLVYFFGKVIKKQREKSRQSD